MVIWTGMSPHSFGGYLALGLDFGRISGFLEKFVSFRDLFSEILDFWLTDPTSARRYATVGAAPVAGYPFRPR